jgi:hypothetical protein
MQLRATPTEKELKEKIRANSKSRKKPITAAIL